jgi:hypothetical protein
MYHHYMSHQSSLSIVFTCSAGLDVQVINNGPVVDASYCIVVKLSFDFTGGTGPQVIHQRTFTFTVEANPDGTATPSPVERVDGFIDITEADSEEVGNDVENRDLTGISLISNPTSEVTYNELVTLTVFAPTCCGAYWYQITAVTIDGTAIAITPNPGAWAIGSTASVTFTIPISVFVVAGQGGDIEIVGTVQWSAVDPSRRALRALQDGSESEQLPESGTTTSTISISVDPASLEEANSVTSAGYSFKITKTMIGATGALAAVAVL